MRHGYRLNDTSSYFTKLALTATECVSAKPYWLRNFLISETSVINDFKSVLWIMFKLSIVVGVNR